MTETTSASRAIRDPSPLSTDHMPVGTVLLLSHLANHGVVLRTEQGWQHAILGLIDLHDERWSSQIQHGAFDIVHRGYPWPFQEGTFRLREQQ